MNVSKFRDDEYALLRQRFYTISKGKMQINKVQFRENMGVLGINHGAYLCDKIFEIITSDSANDNKYLVNFKGYVKYMEIMQRGSNEEKLRVGFRIFAKEDIDDPRRTLVIDFI